MMIIFVGLSWYTAMSRLLYDDALLFLSSITDKATDAAAVVLVGFDKYFSTPELLLHYVVLRLRFYYYLTY